MSIKRILLPVSNQDDITQMADFAFTLAAHHKAEVRGIFPQHNVWIDEWMDNWGLSAGEIETLEVQAKQNSLEEERLAQEAFDAHAARHQKVVAKFASTIDNPDRSLLDQAIYADIAVIGNMPNARSRYWQHLLIQMLTQSTKPVFIAPPRPVDEALGTRVVIAWNQSPEASRAVTAAMPLIERASHVVIVTVGRKVEQHSMESLREFVSLHASDVEVAVLDPDGQKTGHLLIDKTAETAGSILVMGAYSHRRWREQVFGGVTEFVLNNTDVPAMMMH